jgi:hypothetical protein
MGVFRLDFESLGGSEPQWNKWKSTQFVMDAFSFTHASEAASMRLLSSGLVPFQDSAENSAS